MKRFYFFLTFLLSAMLTFGETMSGTSEDNLAWSLDTETGTLTISGNGDMNYYDPLYVENTTTAPWGVYSRIIQSIVIENGVTSIGGNAFYCCLNVTSVTIPTSVTSIEERAFEDCYSLTSIDIPNSVTSIGYAAFSGCARLTSVTIPTSMTSIEERAFSYCSSLTSVSIPNSVTSIGDDVFLHCPSLTTPIVANGMFIKLPESFYGDYFIPDGVEQIIGGAFNGCVGVFSVTIPNSMTSIGGAAFNNCSGLTSIDIPNSVTSIGWCAFFECPNLASVTIPSSVTSIEAFAFGGCPLTSITIPNSVTSIGEYAFAGCDGLTSVINLATTPQMIDPTVFTTFGDLHVLPGCGDAYRKADVWNQFNIIEDADAITSPVADRQAVVKGIYTIDGKQVENESAIHSGIYIKNGKMHIKR